MGGSPNIGIIGMRKVPFMDTTGANNLKNLIAMSYKDKTETILSGVNKEVHSVLVSSGIADLIGEDHICSNIHDAIERSKLILAEMEETTVE